jgi:selenocysteine lyase/cysteine desulfurase
MSDYTVHFRRSLAAAPERLHLAAHSHHLWPDAAFEGHEEAANDAAHLADRKWDRVFGEVIPEVQRGLAQVLSLPDGASLTFAPNTHDLMLRVFSTLPLDRPARVLTTSGEFHSFSRQLQRFHEDGLVQVTYVDVTDLHTLEARLEQALSETPFDVVFLSQVFFQSGYVLGNVETLVTRALAVNPEVLFILDGYHGFLARPTDLSSIAARAFYLSGGYKYAMSGEGVCFLHAPEGVALRPRITGWFASFGALTQRSTEVAYAKGGARFLGSTFDPSGLYRMAHVLRWLSRERITPAHIHEHSRRMSARFAEGVDAARLAFKSADLVVPVASPQRGNFLSYRFEGAAAAQAKLESNEVICDVRDGCLRFGFGLYHDEALVETSKSPAKLCCAWSSKRGNQGSSVPSACDIGTSSAREP